MDRRCPSGVCRSRYLLTDLRMVAAQGNEAYALTELKIPTLSTFLLTTDLQEHSAYGRHSCSGHPEKPQNVARYFRTRLNEPETSDLSRRFCKQDLFNAKIINQVDRKFIACLIEGDAEDPDSLANGCALVLIDQHAADERIRVERFLKELCQGFLQWEGGASGLRTKELSPAMSVLLTRREAFQLGGSNDIQSAFKSWGFHFGDLNQMSEEKLEEDMDVGGSSSYVQVLVRSVPEIVSDKVCISLSSFLPSDDLMAICPF